MTIQSIIETAWGNRATISIDTRGDVRDAVEDTLAKLDAGALRVAEKIDGQWRCHQWIKQAILLSFRLNDNQLYAHGPYLKTDMETPDNYSYWWDKVPSKFTAWNEAEFRAAGFRAVPGSFVRRGSFVAPGVVLMPSFVNIGAYVGNGTMVDTWVTIGSCAQIGANCHISGGVGIGGVLEPLQANPVIIEDHCFIGARSEIAEGVIVETGAVISMGVFIGASTKIVDRATGEIFYGRVPAYSVVVPGTLPPPLSPPRAGGIEGGYGDPHLAAAIIVKRVDEKTRSKTSINELLRD